jgi:Thioredoxin domain-containing protein
MKPMLEEIAAEQEGKIKVVAVNIDQSAATARAFNVRSLPTLLLFKNGQPVAQKVGAARKADVR